MKKFLLYITIILSVSSEVVHAQDKGLGNETFTVETAWTPTLGDAYKISDSPKTDTLIPASPQLSYSITPIRLKTSFDLNPIKAVKVKDEMITKFYKNLVKLGFGNYTTPYFELFTNNLRSKEFSLGAHIKHLSSAGQIKGYGPSGFSDNIVNVYGTRYLPNYAISADVNYNRNMVHFYGYDANLFSGIKEKNIRQRFNHFNTNVEFASRYMDDVRVNHVIGLHYDYLGDLFTAKEHDIIVEAVADKKYDSYIVGLSGNVDFINYKNSISTLNRSIFNLAPTVSVSQPDWSLTGGFKTAVETDTNTKVHFYPHAIFSYKIIDKLLIFNATYTGGIQKNNYRSLSSENPFISPYNSFKNTNIKVDVSGELKSSLSTNTGLIVGAGYKEMDNMALYIAGYPLPGVAYGVIYDNASLVNIHGELTHQRSERIRFTLQGDYFKYTMEHETKAWHKPDYSISAGINYNIQNKIILKSDVYTLGKRYARGIDASNNEYIIPLSAFFDVNLGVEYRYTKLLSAFINFNNLGAARYFQWNNYPAQRFNMMAGLTYSF